MADYYSILKKTVSGLPSNTADTRKLVYAKARTTIDKQLRSMNPPPSEDAVTAQMNSLEQAIERLEAEYAYEQPADDFDDLAAIAAADVAPAAPEVGVRATPQAPARDLRDGEIAAERQAPAYETQRPEKRGSRLAGFIVILFLLLLVGGGAYAVWLNKDLVMELAGLNQATVETQESEEDATPAETGEAEEAGKEEVRLGQNGETIVAETNEDDAGASDDQPVSQPREVRTVEPRDTPEVNPVSEDNGSEQTAQTESETDNETQVPVPEIGQKAYLYEEGLSNAAASRDNAAIIWSLDREAPGEGLPEEAVVRGKLEVPARGLTMDLTLRRNVDETLSASHLIELVFNAPPDFSGGNVDTLARFVMKSSEGARGEPLIAVPVRIDSGYFMIALNNLDQARQSNKRLLLESSWIDIPLSYTTGRRALVTLEKGAIGDQVFRDAFADWENR